MKRLPLVILASLLMLSTGSAEAHRSGGSNDLPTGANKHTIAQSLGGFKNQTELNRKYKQVKKGWTRAQVEALLGKPQWGYGAVYNYFIDQNKDIKVINFSKSGVVISFGGGAG